MTDFEYRKVMWVFLSDLFDDPQEAASFVWLFNEDDQREASLHPDGALIFHGFDKGIS